MGQYKGMTQKTGRAGQYNEYVEFHVGPDVFVAQKLGPGVTAAGNWMTFNGTKQGKSQIQLTRPTGSFRYKDEAIEFVKEKALVTLGVKNMGDWSQDAMVARRKASRPRRSTTKPRLTR